MTRLSELNLAFNLNLSLTAREKEIQIKKKVLGDKLLAAYA